MEIDDDPSALAAETTGDFAEVLGAHVDVMAADLSGAASVKVAAWAIGRILVRTRITPLATALVFFRPHGFEARFHTGSTPSRAFVLSHFTALPKSAMGLTRSRIFRGFVIGTRFRCCPTRVGWQAFGGAKRIHFVETCFSFHGKGVRRISARTTLRAAARTALRAAARTALRAAARTTLRAAARTTLRAAARTALRAAARTALFAAARTALFAATRAALRSSVFPTGSPMRGGGRTPVFIVIVRAANHQPEQRQSSHEQSFSHDITVPRLETEQGQGRRADGDWIDSPMMGVRIQADGGCEKRCIMAVFHDGTEPDERGATIPNTL